MDLINVLIVEDDPMAMRHLTSLVKSDRRYHMIYKAESAAMAEIYCAGGCIDLVLMDIVTAMNASGLEAAVKIKKAYPKIKIIIITSQLDADLLYRSRAGAIDSFGYKLQTDDELLTLMERTICGESVYPDFNPTAQLGCAISSEIDEQHMNVLRELCGALTDEEIAYNLHLSVHTVRKYIQHLLNITGFRNRTQLAVEAQKQKIVTFGY